MKRKRPAYKKRTLDAQFSMAGAYNCLEGHLQGRDIISMHSILDPYGHSVRAGAGMGDVENTIRAEIQEKAMKLRELQDNANKLKLLLDDDDGRGTSSWHLFLGERMQTLVDGWLDIDLAKLETDIEAALHDKHISPDVRRQLIQHMMGILQQHHILPKKAPDPHGNKHR